tara:strand:- start:12 stop:635 length:624 start_codon:yes stop_codon:yes gene_type:complete
MSNKLQNIKAIKQMLEGKHKSQTRQSHYFGKSNNEIPEDDIIESFEDGKPKIWIETDHNGHRTRVTQHDGFKSREPENSILKTIQNALKVPEKCPECGKNMRDHEKRLNFKFWFKRKKCFECVLKEESKIKAQGREAWKEYENKIMKSNAEAWFKDADKEVEILKNQIVKTWQNADGEFGEADMSSFLEKMEKDYNELKESLREKYK